MRLTITKTFIPSALFAAALAPFGTVQALAEGPTQTATTTQSSAPAAAKMLEQTSGPWKASCFTDSSGPEPYCRIMVVHIFNKSAQNPDFAQFGPAFDRDNLGFIVATYYGFGKESRITIGIDDNLPIDIPAPVQGNHIVAPANITAELLKQMQAGKDIHVEFKMAMRGKKKLTYPLDGFRELKVGVDRVMGGE